MKKVFNLSKTDFKRDSSFLNLKAFVYAVTYKLY